MVRLLHGWENPFAPPELVAFGGELSGSDDDWHDSCLRQDQARFYGARRQQCGTGRYVQPSLRSPGSGLAENVSSRSTRVIGLDVRTTRTIF